MSLFLRTDKQEFRFPAIHLQTFEISILKSLQTISPYSVLSRSNHPHTITPTANLFYYHKQQSADIIHVYYAKGNRQNITGTNKFLVSGQWAANCQLYHAYKNSQFENNYFNNNMKKL